MVPRRANRLAAFHKIDLIETDSIETAAGQIRSSAGAIWGLVYCAGVYPICRLDDYTLPMWREVQTVNLQAAFYVTRLLEPSIRKGGRVIFVSSAASFLGSADVGYSVSKTGLIGLVRSLAKNFSKRGILVNAVCPGPIRSPMSARMPKNSVRSYLRRIPLGRFGKPEEVAVAVEFLLQPANSYMTGTSLDVSGGLAMH